MDLTRMASKKLKIASVVAVYPPYGGGLGTVARENAQMLSEIGDVTVFSPRYPRIRERSRSDGKVKVEFLTPFFSYGNAAFLPQLFWKLRSFDIIHLHYPFIGSSIPAILAKIVWRKKLITTYHMDLIGARQPYQAIFSCINFLSPSVLRFADRLLVTSRDYVECSVIAQLVKIKPHSVVELPISINEKIFLPRDRSAALLERYGIPSHAPVILFVGGLDTPHYFKGVEVLLRASALLAAENLIFHVLVVGDGDLLPQYQQLSGELGIAERIHFVGSLATQNELVDCYALSTVLVLPSVDRSEAFGVVLAEAGACARPVIASNLPGVRSVVDNGTTGFLISPGDDADCAEKIRLVLLDESIAQRMGEQGRIRILAQYANIVVSKILVDTVNTL